jgi:RNA polymerase sigma factor (sigma-70 family)
VALTAKKIEMLKPVVRYLALSFEQAGKRVAFDLSDLEQEAWLVARRVEKRKPENLKACVSRSIRNRFIDLTESPDPTEDLNGHDFAAPEAAEDCDPRLSAAVETALSQLPDRQHRIVRLIFGIGCNRHSQVEVSKKLKISRGSVQNDLREAVSKLGMLSVLKGEWLKEF